MADERPLRVFGAILLRDMTVARRELPYFLLRTTLQPLLFVIIFGFLMPKMGIVRAGYTSLMLPGILALSLTLSSIQSVSLPMMQDFGFTKEIEDRLLSPISHNLVAIEKMVSGVLQGIVAALFVLPIARLIMGPIPGLSFEHLSLLLAITILGGAAFSAIGLFLGTGIPPQQIGLMFSVILGPMIMFGLVKYLILVNPLVYVSEGMRAALTPSVPHMALWGIIAALAAITVIFTYLGLRTFEKRAIG